MSDINSPPFHIGDTVFVPWANAYQEQRVICPICNGKKSVTLILGSGENVPVECDACARGYEGPTGYVEARLPCSGVYELRVTGMEFADGVWVFRVGHDTRKEFEIYSTYATADACRSSMHEQEAKRAEQNYESRFRNSQGKLSWTVRYHRSQIKDLERQLSWHRNKLSERKV